MREISAKISLLIFATISEAPKPDMVACDPYEAFMLPKDLFLTRTHDILTKIHLFEKGRGLLQ